MVAQPFVTKERYGCGIPLAGAILCRCLQVRTNLQPEIATTSVRTGLAMTSRAALPFEDGFSFFISTTAGAFDRSRFF